MRHAADAARLRRSSGSARSRRASSSRRSPSTVEPGPDGRADRLRDRRQRRRRRVASHALHTLRDTVIPPIAGDAAGHRGGRDRRRRPARTTSTTRCATRLPYVFLFVLGLAFVLLLLTFRSLVIAATAVALNLLSVGAAYGILVAVFQHGWLAGRPRLPDERRDRQLAAAVPLRRPLRPLDGLPRLHPQPDQGAARRAATSTDDAIRLAITRTAGTVTSAAIIMVAVFGAVRDA